jgi:hypothetical protein
MFWALLCFALLCSSFSKIARSRATWCGVLFSSSSTFLKIFPGSPVMLWRSSSLLLLSFSKIFRVRPMFWTLSLSLSGNIENLRPPSPWCGALVRFSFVIVEKKNRVRPHVLYSPPLSLYILENQICWDSMLCALFLSLSTSHSPNPDMRDSHVLCSPLFLKNDKDQKHMCARFVQEGCVHNRQSMIICSACVRNSKMGEVCRLQPWRLNGMPHGFMSSVGLSKTHSIFAPCPFLLSKISHTAYA